MIVKELEPLLDEEGTQAAEVKRRIDQLFDSQPETEIEQPDGPGMCRYFEATVGDGRMMGFDSQAIREELVSLDLVTTLMQLYSGGPDDPVRAEIANEAPMVTYATVPVDIGESTYRLMVAYWGPQTHVCLAYFGDSWAKRIRLEPNYAKKAEE